MPRKPEKRLLATRTAHPGKEDLMQAWQMKHGAFGWIELLTPDAAGAKEFYAKLFGWSLRDEPAGGMAYTVIRQDGNEVGGIMTIPDEVRQMGVPPHWGIYVTVDDVDAVAVKAGQMGGKVLKPPMDIPGVGRFCVLMDPQGAVLQVITYTMK
jgi:predicted enzyme related to lactoylglutathione lyase